MDNKERTRYIIKSYRAEIWNPFIQALKDFTMIEEGDKIAVAFSGGKDSILLSYLLIELKKHSKVNFDLTFLSVDANYNDVNERELRNLADIMEIDLKICKSELYDVVRLKNPKSACFLCSRMRRGFLYDKALEMGSNKLALGHHRDDVIETIMLNILYQGKYMTMMPKIKAKNFDNIELIRPMYYIEERDVEKWIKRAEIKPCSKSCPLKEGSDTGMRQRVKEMITAMEKDNKNVKKSIQKSAHNVYIDAVVGLRREEKEEPS